VLALRRIAKNTFLGDSNEIAELMDLHRATFRCEEFFV
jgi:hypothetical protein